MSGFSHPGTVACAVLSVAVCENNAECPKWKGAHRLSDSTAARGHVPVQQRHLPEAATRRTGQPCCDTLHRKEGLTLRGQVNPPRLASPFWGMSAQPQQPVRSEMVKRKWHIQECRWPVLVSQVLQWKSSSCPFGRNAVPQSTAWNKASGSVGPSILRGPCKCWGLAHCRLVGSTGMWQLISPKATCPVRYRVGHSTYFFLTSDIIGLGKSFLKSQLKTCF